MRMVPANQHTHTTSPSPSPSPDTFQIVVPSHTYSAHQGQTPEITRSRPASWCSYTCYQNTCTYPYLCRGTPAPVPNQCSPHTNTPHRIYPSGFTNGFYYKYAHAQQHRSPPPLAGQSIHIHATKLATANLQPHTHTHPHPHHHHATQNPKKSSDSKLHPRHPPSEGI